MPDAGSLVNVNVDLKDAPKQVRKITEHFARFGMFFIPGHVRKLAQAEADAKVIHAKADAEAGMIRTQAAIDQRLALAQANQELMERAVTRLGFREIKRQRNLELIEGKAIELAQSEASDGASDEPVSDEFMCAFADNSQDISENTMQDLWAKILVKEFAKPGSFSPRTLDILKTMRREDAELFTKFCRFAWNFAWDGSHMVPNVTAIARTRMEIDVRPINQHDLIEEEGVEYTDRLHLEALGLIKTAGFGQLYTLKAAADAPRAIAYHKQEYYLIPFPNPKHDEESLTFSVDLLTSFGDELFRVCNPRPHEAFRDQFFRVLGNARLAVKPHVPAAP